MKRIGVIGACIALLVVVVAFSLRDPGVAVDVYTVNRMSVREYIAEEAKTRLEEEYRMDMPIAGTVERITWEEGDTIHTGDVLARIDSYPLEQQTTMEVKGRDMVAGVPKTIVVNSDEIREALSEPINAIVEAVLVALERTPPELAADIVDKGIVLTGGGSLLKNLDVLLREETGLPVMVCDDPISAVVLGSGKALDHMELLKEVTIG